MIRVCSSAHICTSPCLMSTMHQVDINIPKIHRQSLVNVRLSSVNSMSHVDSGWSHVHSRLYKLSISNISGFQVAMLTSRPGKNLVRPSKQLMMPSMRPTGAEMNLSFLPASLKRYCPCSLADHALPGPRSQPHSHQGVTADSSYTYFRLQLFSEATRPLALW